jgi:hypothetical protein
LEHGFEQIELDRLPSFEDLKIGLFGAAALRAVRAAALKIFANSIASASNGCPNDKRFKSMVKSSN